MPSIVAIASIALSIVLLVVITKRGVQENRRTTCIDIFSLHLTKRIHTDCLSTGGAERQGWHRRKGGRPHSLAEYRRGRLLQENRDSKPGEASGWTGYCTPHALSLLCCETAELKRERTADVTFLLDFVSSAVFALVRCTTVYVLQRYSSVCACV